MIRNSHRQKIRQRRQRMSHIVDSSADNRLLCCKIRRGSRRQLRGRRLQKSRGIRDCLKRLRRLRPAALRHQLPQPRARQSNRQADTAKLLRRHIIRMTRRGRSRVKDLAQLLRCKRPGSPRRSRQRQGREDGHHQRKHAFRSPGSRHAHGLFPLSLMTRKCYIRPDSFDKQKAAKSQ